jgi:hypothetical protein
MIKSHIFQQRKVDVQKYDSCVVYINNYTDVLHLINSEGVKMLCLRRCSYLLLTLYMLYDLQTFLDFNQVTVWLHFIL